MKGEDPDRISLSATERALELLAEHGDALNSVRNIDHYSYFPTAEGRSRFLDKCLCAGFKLNASFDTDFGEERHAVIVCHDDIPDEEILLKLHAMLSEFAAVEGGRYDGWEAQLVV